jgi:hypothetical protein
MIIDKRKRHIKVTEKKIGRKKRYYPNRFLFFLQGSKSYLILFSYKDNLSVANINEKTNFLFS